MLYNQPKVCINVSFLEIVQNVFTSWIHCLVPSPTKASLVLDALLVPGPTKSSPVFAKLVLDALLVPGPTKSSLVLAVEELDALLLPGPTKICL